MGGEKVVLRLGIYWQVRPQDRKLNTHSVVFQLPGKIYGRTAELTWGKDFKGKLEA